MKPTLVFSVTDDRYNTEDLAEQLAVRFPGYAILILDGIRLDAVLPADVAP